MVFVGVPSPPSGEWPVPPFTKVAKTPVVREKPFLAVDAQGNYFVACPSCAATARRHMARRLHAGQVNPLDRFYIAHPGDTASAINAQLAAGKNLALHPGIYELAEAIRVTVPAAR